MQAATKKSSWENTAMLLLVLASLAMFATIAYTVSFQDLSNASISYVSGLLISVTGILLGLSGLTSLSKSLERMKLQTTLTITTLLWLLAVVMIAQISPVFLTNVQNAGVRYLFFAGIVLFTILVIMYSTSIVEATKQRLMREQVAIGQSEKASG